MGAEREHRLLVLRDDIAPSHDGGHGRRAWLLMRDHVAHLRIIERERRGFPNLPANQLIHFGGFLRQLLEREQGNPGGRIGNRRTFGRTNSARSQAPRSAAVTWSAFTTLGPVSAGVTSPSANGSDANADTTRPPEPLPISAM